MFTFDSYCHCSLQQKLTTMISNPTAKKVANGYFSVGEWTVEKVRGVVFVLEVCCIN
jgi:hypothetical protein